MGPCTACARRPTVDSRCRGTTIICCVADLRRCLPTTSATGVQQSTRYCGALPCRHLWTMTPSLYEPLQLNHNNLRPLSLLCVYRWLITVLHYYVERHIEMWPMTQNSFIKTWQLTTHEQDRQGWPSTYSGPSKEKKYMWNFLIHLTPHDPSETC